MDQPNPKYEGCVSTLGRGVLEVFDPVFVLFGFVLTRRFSSSLACLGLHLAIKDMALAAATFFRTFPNARLPPQTNAVSMEMENYFLVAPKSHECVIIVSP